MVGGESLGCRTCKQRKIKCDERRPICRNCEKSKRICTGPESAFRFYYGSNAQRASIESAIARAAPSLQRKSVRQWSIAPGRVDGMAESIAPAVPSSAADQSRRMLVFVLNAQHPGLYSLQQLGSFFGELPARLGQSTALDAVIECFVSSYARRYLPQQIARAADSSSDLIVYGNAIKALREALDDPFAQDCEETLCAALSLFLYEFFMQEPSKQCVSLAGGVSSILKAWGPSRITSRFALTLFESHYITIIAHSLVFGKECFISGPGWEKVFKACPNIEPEERAIWLTLSRIPKFLDNVRGLCSGLSTDTVRISGQGHHLRQLILALSWHNSKALSRPQIQNKAPELYEGPTPVPSLATQDTLSAYDIVARNAFLRAGLVAVSTALRRIGENSIDRFVEDQENSDWLCRTMPVAERFGVLNGSYFTLAAVAAFGLSDIRQRHILTNTCARLLSKGALLPTASDTVSPELYQTTYVGLQHMHNTMTGGPVLGGG